MSFDQYQSPFSWRYGTPEMRAIWSEEHKRLLWRRIWLALAEVQAEYGLVSPNQIEDLRANAGKLDIARSFAIEKEIQHDLMAELRTFAEQAAAGGKILHLGATSADIEDNADALRMKEAVALLLGEIRDLLRSVSNQIERWAETPIIALTHLQPAEPSTLGYRLAVSGQDWLASYQEISRLEIRGKGFKGAVGSGAAYSQLIGVQNADGFEKKLSQRLDLPFYPVTGQVYPRSQDYNVVSSLALLGASLNKFAFDLRLLQSPYIGELAEPFGQSQVGSSAMPFKRNPVHSEKIDSLGRVLAGYPRIAWDNAAQSLFERTLDDSASRRVLLPESFLACEEMVRTTRRNLDGLQVNLNAIQSNLERFAPFTAAESILMAVSSAGGDRQRFHELLRQHAMTAWEHVQAGEPNPYFDLIRRDAEFHDYLSDEDISRLTDAETQVGFAASRARQLAGQIRTELASSKDQQQAR